MLGIRTAEKSDIPKIERFIQHEKIELVHPFDFLEREWMIIEDQDIILGYAVGIMKAGKPYVETIYIPEKLRGHLLGDAVLRGLLYYMLGRGFAKAYAEKATPIAPFLMHEGFQDEDLWLGLELNDFFDRKCRGCRESQ